MVYFLLGTAGFGRVRWPDLGQTPQPAWPSDHPNISGQSQSRSKVVWGLGQESTSLSSENCPTGHFDWIWLSEVVFVVIHKFHLVCRSWIHNLTCCLRPLFSKVYTSHVWVQRQILVSKILSSSLRSWVFLSDPEFSSRILSFPFRAWVFFENSESERKTQEFEKIEFLSLKFVHPFLSIFKHKLWFMN